MSNRFDDLDALLRSAPGDAGCTAGESILDVYVDLELSGQDPAKTFPGTAIHLSACPGCASDHDGLLNAARQYGDLTPD